MTPAIAEKLRRLPKAPGCYLFRNAEQEMLYVGKAINLKSRVKSYFQSSGQLSNRVARMVARIADLDWIVVDSELEALILECNLIKQHRPIYNVRLRDDKSYPYIVITKEAFPRVLLTRRLRKDGSRYFGPYSNAGAVRETLQLLHKVFRLIPCGKSWSGEAVQRPCLYYHLGRCMAPCAGIADQKEYSETIRNVTLFLEGKQNDLTERLTHEMQTAVEQLDFESAARLRDSIQSIEAVLERQKVVASSELDQDVIAVVKDTRGAAVQMFYVRGGKLIGQKQFLLDGAADANSSHAVEEFIKRYYTDAPEIPNEVLLPVEIEEKKIIATWLKQKRGKAVNIIVPRGGEKLKLVEMAALNADLALQQMQQEEMAREEWAASAANELEEVLKLSSAPFRIECYDISNIQGTAPVASMVVFEGGQENKNEYRRFKIKYNPESPDDFAMMREAILRRLRAYRDGKANFSTLPDLIVIDGGRGQLSAAIQAMDEIGISIPTIGLAKKKEHIILRNQPEPIELPLASPALTLLRRLRDEAHRFALSYHRKLRDKRMLASPLDEIPGIGPRRRRLLLRNFGSVEAIRRASVEAIAAVPTMTSGLAKKVKSALEE